MAENPDPYQLPTTADHTAFPAGGSDTAGLTKREFFAALAMAGLIGENDLDLEKAAQISVNAAAHLIAALNAQ